MSRYQAMLRSMSFTVSPTETLRRRRVSGCLRGGIAGLMAGFFVAALAGAFLPGAAFFATTFLPAFFVVFLAAAIAHPFREDRSFTHASGQRYRV